MAGQTTSRLHLVIKNPGRDAKADFKVDVEAASSLGQVKQMLHREYVGHPSPETQTVSPSSGLLQMADMCSVALAKHLPRTTAGLALHKELARLSPPAKRSTVAFEVIGRC